MDWRNNRGYRWVRARKAKDRLFPRRSEWRLRKAVDKCDIADVQYEYEFEDWLHERFHYFDVCGRAYDQYILIDVLPNTSKRGLTKEKAEILEQKKASTHSIGVPYLQLVPSLSTNEMIVHIRLFLLKVKKGAFYAS